jgi:hypothetical protein
LLRPPRLVRKQFAGQERAGFEAHRARRLALPPRPHKNVPQAQRHRNSRNPPIRDAHNLQCVLCTFLRKSMQSEKPFLSVTFRSSLHSRAFSSLLASFLAASDCLCPQSQTPNPKPKTQNLASDCLYPQSSASNARGSNTSVDSTSGRDARSLSA